MKRTLTRMVSAVCAAALGIGCFSFGAGAKVIEPEIVKTEKWTTSYYIDDDMDTLYPYIQCEADIYNDGTIKLYMWNTHEWDGFASIKQDISFVCSDFYSTNSLEFAAKYRSSNYTDISVTSGKDPSSIDLSYYPQQYTVSHTIGQYNQLYFWFTSSTNDYSLNSIVNFKVSNFEARTNNSIAWGSISCQKYTGMSLAEMNYYTERPIETKTGKKVFFYTFTPKETPTGTYNFRLYGHDITITPELLSGNIVAEPELTEQEQKIKQLEAENAALKAQLAAFDSDADGLLTTADAQMILIYYTEYLAGAVSGTTGDYAAYIKQFKGQ